MQIDTNFHHFMDDYHIADLYRATYMNPIFPMIMTNGMTCLFISIFEHLSQRKGLAPRSIGGLSTSVWYARVMLQSFWRSTHDKATYMIVDYKSTIYPFTLKCHFNCYASGYKEFHTNLLAKNVPLVMNTKVRNLWLT